jgi:hypothetical protein
MCDYCNCRSHPEIAALSTDHEGLQRSLGRLAAATATGDGKGAAAATTSIAAVLERHARREEAGIFAQLRRADVDDAYLAHFEADHETIHALVAEASDDPESARALIRLLGDHIAREESDLFPAAHQLLTAQQWDVIATQEGSP